MEPQESERLTILFDESFSLTERCCRLVVSLDGRSLFILPGAQLHLLDVLVRFPDQVESLQVDFAVSVGNRRILAVNHGADVFLFPRLFLVSFRLYESEFFYSLRGSLIPSALLTSFSASSRLHFFASEISRVN